MKIHVSTIGVVQAFNCSDVGNPFSHEMKNSSLSDLLMPLTFVPDAPLPANRKIEEPINPGIVKTRARNTFGRRLF